jgi:hypothetical protein
MEEPMTAALVTETKEAVTLEMAETIMEAQEMAKMKKMMVKTQEMAEMKELLEFLIILVL